MIPNKLKQLWSQGKPTINGWCSIGNTFTAEIMAARGYDSITIDLQHRALDYSSALPGDACFRHRSDGARTLDGAGDHYEGARRGRLRCDLSDGERRQAGGGVHQLSAISATRPTERWTHRVSFAAGTDYGAKANKEMLAFAMIETAQGMADLSSIAATPGLDGIYVGPADLTPRARARAASPPASTVRSSR